MDIIEIESRAAWLALRSKNISSTEVSALFDISPYTTELELYYQKLEGATTELDDNERMKWGRRLESVIAEGVGEDNKWEVKPLKQYMQIASKRMGSSFDYSIEKHPEKEGKGILEIKNVDWLIFKDQWTLDEDGNLEAPLHIELQVQHQMHVSGRKYAYIAVLMGGNKIHLIEREYDEEIGKEIEVRVAQFWNRVDKKILPQIDWERDAEFIAKLNQYATPDKVMTLVDETNPIYQLVHEYKNAADEEKEAAKKKEVAKAKLLTMIGDHEKVTSSKFTISAGVVGPSEVSYTRQGYRNFRVTMKKQKEV